MLIAVRKERERERGGKEELQVVHVSMYYEVLSVCFA